MVRWAVAGIGDITTRRVIPAILAEPRSTLYGIITRDPRKAERYPGVRVWTELDAALSDSHVDAVYVATPVFLHAPQSIAALRAGKHVLCEKPMALDYGQASSMVSTARAAGRTLGVAYYRRTYPKIRRLQQLLAEGVIGTPVLAEANCHDWFQDEDGRRSWLLDPAQSGGGPLYDIASHRIDLMNLLFGRPARAVGLTSNVVHPGAVEDAASVLIDYDSGARAYVDVRWHSRVSRDQFRVIGTEGEIDLSPLNGPLLRSPRGVEDLPAHANLHYPSIADFVAALAEDRAPVSSGESAVLTDWVTAQVTMKKSPHV